MDFKTKADANMKARIAKLKDELNRVRTGRAAPALLEGLKMEYYGQLVALKSVGAISAPDARTLEVRPWDQTQLVEVEKTLNKADLGSMAKVDGQVVRVTLPTMTEDRRKDLVRVVGKLAEDYRVAVRGDRREAMEEVKKALKEKNISEDDQKTAGEVIQKLTDAYIKQVDEIAGAKQKEITTI
ncbi:MAG: ribosome recycling factor [Elusimicrobia bacterium]|nr:ribosome recycling factor [Elusimicrobiota bacterium]